MLFEREKERERNRDRETERERAVVQVKEIERAVISKFI